MRPQPVALGPFFFQFITRNPKHDVRPIEEAKRILFSKRAKRILFSKREEFFFLGGLRCGRSPSLFDSLFFSLLPGIRTRRTSHRGGCLPSVPSRRHELYFETMSSLALRLSRCLYLRASLAQLVVAFHT